MSLAFVILTFDIRHEPVPHHYFISPHLFRCLHFVPLRVVRIGLLLYQCVGGELRPDLCCLCGDLCPVLRRRVALGLYLEHVQIAGILPPGSGLLVGRLHPALLLHPSPHHLVFRRLPVSLVGKLQPVVATLLNRLHHRADGHRHDFLWCHRSHKLFPSSPRRHIPDRAGVSEYVVVSTGTSVGRDVHRRDTAVVPARP